MPLGWLSPDGKMYECDYMDHLYLAEKLIKEYNYTSEDTNIPDEILLEQGWCHITRLTFMDFGFAIFWTLPWKRHLTKKQHNYLLPYMKEKPILSEATKRDVKEEFKEVYEDELFY